MGEPDRYAADYWSRIPAATTSVTPLTSFATAGSFAVTCTIHPTMKQVVKLAP